MAEEHKCQSPPEGLRLCANNCGFFGSPATLNLCSKCYRDLRLKEDQESSAKIAVEKSLVLAATSAAPPPPPLLPPLLPKDKEPHVRTPAAALETVQPPPPSASPSASSTSFQQQPQPPAPTRCTACRKRVGLTGFRCRCGDTYCGAHRYPEQHKCSFDFKSAGKEAIARANPVVKAQKLDKI